MSTTITNTMISIHTSSMDMVSSVGGPMEAKNQCEGNATFWLYNLIETKEFICIIDALPSPGLNPLEGPTMLSCGRVGLEGRSRLPALKRGRGAC